MMRHARLIVCDLDRRHCALPRRGIWSVAAAGAQHRQTWIHTGRRERDGIELHEFPVGCFGGKKSHFRKWFRGGARRCGWGWIVRCVFMRAGAAECAVSEFGKLEV